MQKSVFNAAVIGAGPAGIASIGVLLDKFGPHCRLLWFDPDFSAGRLHFYSQVPSNTRVCLFSKFARACESFKAAENEILAEMERTCDGQRGCQLDWPRRLCLQLTETLRADPRVLSIQSRVIDCRMNSRRNCKDDCEPDCKDDCKSNWNLTTEDGQQFSTEKIILATGSQPLSLPLPNVLDLDAALNPLQLSAHLQNSQTVAVWGSSHSAMLVLMNLIRHHRHVQVYNFYRSPLLFAEIPDPLGAPDVIINDNTGLKGEVAEWVRSWSEEAKYDGHVGTIEEFFDGKLKRICLSKTDSLEAAVKNFSQIQLHIPAIGYTKNPLPHFTPPLPAPEKYSRRGELIEGVFGFGIAFPERLGDGDLAVGMWKFMKYIQRSLSEW